MAFLRPSDSSDINLATAGAAHALDVAFVRNFFRRSIGDEEVERRENAGQWTASRRLRLRTYGCWFCP